MFRIVTVVHQKKSLKIIALVYILFYVHPQVTKSKLWSAWLTWCCIDNVTKQNIFHDADSSLSTQDINIILWEPLSSYTFASWSNSQGVKCSSHLHLLFLYINVTLESRIKIPKLIHLFTPWIKILEAFLLYQTNMFPSSPFPWIHRYITTTTPAHTGQPPRECDDTRCCIIQFELLMMSTVVLKTCRRIK